MKDIKNLKPYQAIVFQLHGEIIALIQNKMVVDIVTDNIQSNEKYSGKITFINKDGLSVDNGDFILWSEIEEINVLYMIGD